MLTATKPILHTLPSKGSGTGHSYYSAFASGCPLAAALNYSDDRSFMDEKSGAAVGTIAHAFLELHFKKILGVEVEPNIVEFGQTLAEENRVEAERCFRFFREKLPEDDILGDVVSVEFEGANDTLFGVPFTYKIDLVTDLTAKHIERLKKRCEFDGHTGALKPGRWLWDYKHYARRDSNLLDKTLNSTQYASYIASYNHAAEAVFDTKVPKANGMIQISIFKTKEIGMRMTVVPFNAQALSAAQCIVEAGAATIPDFATQTIPTEGNCFAYGGICRWLKEDLCDRSGPTESALAQLKKGGFIK